MTSRLPRWERTAPNVLTIFEEFSGSDWERYYLLSSDRHHDNLHCNQELEREHLEQALDRDAVILDFGDLSCAMQGKWDKRADPAQMRPELHGDYLDRLVEYNARFYAPYARNWALMAPGNHETAIHRHHQTNLVERIAATANVLGDGSIQTCTYAGWVRFSFTRNSTRRQSIRLAWTHGYGGGGPVTRDVIQTARQAVYLANADIVASGHTHDSWSMPIAREYLNEQTGLPEIKETTFVKCGGYKDEYSGGEGWAREKGHPPKPLGAQWLRFYVNRDRIEYDVVRAK